MPIWKDLRERMLLGGAVFAFVQVCLINIRFPMPALFERTILEHFLRSDATVNVTSSLLTGLISAYIFYIVIELLPRHSKEQSTLRILNLLVASIIDAYERTRIFGHETPITSIDLSTLNAAKLDAHAQCVQKRVANFLKLKFAMETAHSRYPDVQHSLGLAASLSPEHALEWLVYSDKVRLLAEVYGTQPKNPEIDDATGLPHVVQVFDKQHMFLQNQYTKAMDDLQSTLQMRVMEVMEASARWVRFTS
ncbi:hypothetical protein [Pseudomonas sp. A-RE-26]|uniref:hypothetical protein n=1 Tax=Pseudomonas sp. A-RE-26 TaxID=2832402 RepID=UPI001CBE057D|nr:hypothetical protein [Pseudomonas sp. A-RE-26]